MKLRSKEIIEQYNHSNHFAFYHKIAALKKMKKILMTLLLLPILAGCGDNRYEKIEDSFFSYVDKTFDDPNVVEKITSVEISDTLNRKYFIKECKNWNNTYIRAKYLNDSVQVIFQNNIKKQLIDLSNPEIRKWVEKYEAILKEQYIYLTTTSNSSHTKYDESSGIPMSVLNLTDAFYVYEIKVREIYGGDRKLNTYYAYVDSANNDNIYIYKNKNFQEINPQMSTILDDYTQFCAGYYNLIDFLQRTTDCAIHINALVEK